VNISRRLLKFDLIDWLRQGAWAMDNFGVPLRLLGKEEPNGTKDREGMEINRLS
jgi:hypothetical protein